MSEQTLPAAVGSSGEVGRQALKHATLTVLADPVADALDDMAALGLHWTRNRERGRMPSGIRAAMLLVAREVLMHADMQERETQLRMDELCGPAAFARNAAEQPTTDAQRLPAGRTD